MAFNSLTIHKIKDAEVRLQTPITELLKRWVTVDFCSSQDIALKLDVGPSTALKIITDYGFLDAVKKNSIERKNLSDKISLQ